MKRLFLTLREPGRFVGTAKAMLPYLWIEVVLPGGSILLAWLFLRKLSKKGGETMRKPLTVIPVALIMALLMGSEAYAAEFHRSTGQVAKVDLTKGTVLLAENGHSRELVVGRSALILDDQGNGLRSLKGLQVGDYVSEECMLQKGGTVYCEKDQRLEACLEDAGEPRVLMRGGPFRGDTVALGKVWLVRHSTATPSRAELSLLGV